MNKIHIVITDDYEIFGNGSGDVKKCLIEPTDAILGVAERCGVPVTLMVEICEYWAFKSEERKGNLPENYRPASWIEEQLIRSVKAGHDIQLHAHPQWMNYVYYPDKNMWEVDPRSWKIASLSYDNICVMLKRAKYDLECLLKQADPGYECFAFRAGAWGIQPEEHVLSALIETGFKLDTTVAPGCVFKDDLTGFDFSEAPNRPYWFVRKDLDIEAQSGIAEFPIFTKEYSVFDKICRKILRKISNDKKKVYGYNGTIKGMPADPLISKLSPRHVMFDFCEQSGSEMLNMLKDAQRRYEEYEWIPLVMIGHSKAFANRGHFEYFIKSALDKGCRFTTFKEIIKRIASEAC